MPRSSARYADSLGCRCLAPSAAACLCLAAPPPLPLVGHPGRLAGAPRRLGLLPLLRLCPLLLLIEQGRARPALHAAGPAGQGGRGAEGERALGGGKWADYSESQAQHSHCGTPSPAIR